MKKSIAAAAMLIGAAFVLTLGNIIPGTPARAQATSTNQQISAVHAAYATLHSQLVDAQGIELLGKLSSDLSDLSDIEKDYAARKAENAGADPIKAALLEYVIVVWDTQDNLVALRNKILPASNDLERLKAALPAGTVNQDPQLSQDELMLTTLLNPMTRAIAIVKPIDDSGKTIKASLAQSANAPTDPNDLSVEAYTQAAAKFLDARLAAGPKASKGGGITVVICGPEQLAKGDCFKHLGN